jgi:hypothetical protein
VRRSGSAWRIHPAFAAGCCIWAACAGASWVACRVGWHPGTSNTTSHSCTSLQAAGWIQLTRPHAPLPCSVFDNTAGETYGAFGNQIAGTFRVGPAPARLASVTLRLGHQNGEWRGITVSLLAVPAGQTLPPNGPLMPLVTSTIVDQPPPYPGTLFTCA